MNFFIERKIKKLTRSLGLLVRKYNSNTSEDARLLNTLKYLKIDCVLDVGANEGQFAYGLIDGGYLGKIISFEPLEGPYTVLSSRAQSREIWSVAERCAIGDREEQTIIHETANSVSSSILPVKESHIASAPDSHLLRKITVWVKPLDKFSSLFEQYSNIFLKIDVQGYERNVLLGATELLASDKLKAVYIETSIIPLYESQDWLLPDTLDFMKRQNFQLYALNPGFTNPRSGQVLQYNGLFVRTENNA